MDFNYPEDIKKLRRSITIFPKFTSYLPSPLESYQCFHDITKLCKRNLQIYESICEWPQKTMNKNLSTKKCLLEVKLKSDFQVLNRQKLRVTSYPL